MSQIDKRFVLNYGLANGFATLDGSGKLPAGQLPTSTGTVTSLSIVSANGLAGTVATATTTPAITLSTTVTGVIKGNGTALSAAVSGTDYVVPSGTVANFSGSLVGDVTGTQGATVLATVNANTGAFGSSTSIPTLTLNAKGLVTAASGNAVIAPAGTLSGTTLNATVVTSSLTSVGTITTGTWTGTTIAIANGGTGQTTKTTAFDALQPMTTGGDLIYGGTSGTGTRLANGTAGQVLASAGTTLAPTWTTLKAPTQQIFTAVGSVTGYVFQIAAITITPTAGATYTNNSVTYTVTGVTDLTGVPLLWTSVTGAQTFSGTTLTKSGGTGDATLTFIGTGTQLGGVVPQTTGTYTTPTGCKMLKVTGVGGGGAGGSGATTAAQSAAGGGGGGGAGFVQYIATPGATYTYSIGTGGLAGASGNNPGLAGGITSLGSGNTFYEALGGFGGYGSASSATAIFTRNGLGGAYTSVVTQPTIAYHGGNGGFGIILGASSAQGGLGGSTIAGVVSSPTNVTQQNGGNQANSYGSGGSGGQTINGGSATTGGQGSVGILIVEEFY